MPGIFLNVDINTVTFPFLKRVANGDRIRENDLFPFIDQYAGTQVTDLAINVFCQISMTPSRVWSDVLDSYHRKEENGVPVDYTDLLDHYHKFYEILGIDPHEVWFRQCRAVEISPWLSVRMNDCHCPDETAVWIRGSEFYEADEKGWKLGEAYGYQRHCYNYANEAFRARMLAYIEEQLLRYNVDGLELDFSREWFCFDQSKTADAAPIMTAFVQEVKHIAEKAASKWGHPVKIHVRFMRDIEQNLALGFDATAMVQAGLIDSLSVAPRWASCDSHLPIAAWKTRFPTLPIYAGITDLTLLAPTDYETAAGYAAAYLAEGADKIYLYNFFTNPDAPNPAYSRAHRTCGALSTLSGVPRRVVVTYADVAPIGTQGWCPLPAKADGFALSVPTGPIGRDEAVAAVIGFDREISPKEVTLSIENTVAAYVGKTAQGKPFADGKNRLCGCEAVRSLHLFLLPKSPKKENVHISLAAADASLTVSYLELVIGARPATVEDK